MCTPLIEHIKKYVPLGETDIALLNERLSIRSVKKKEFILVPGKTCPANYFVVKGCLRLFL